MTTGHVITRERFIEPVEKIHIGKYGGNSPVHTHEFIELVYVFAGSADHMSGGVSTRVSQGDCFLIDLETEHGYENADDEFTVLNCLFQPSFLSAAIRDDELFKQLAVNVFVAFSKEEMSETLFVKSGMAPGISTFFGQMLAEYERKEVGYLEVLQSLLKVVLIYLFRGSKTAVQPKIVTDILKYLSEAGGRKIKIEELSEAMFFSPAHISRLFKKYTGKNLSDFMRENRLEYVCEKLVTTNASIDAILVEYGYNDKKNFYEQFHRIYGCTPKEYRINFLQGKIKS